MFCLAGIKILQCSANAGWRADVRMANDFLSTARVHATCQYSRKHAGNCAWGGRCALLGEREGLRGEREAAVQGHQEAGLRLEGEDEAQAVLGVVLQLQLQRLRQEAPVAPAQLAQQLQRLRGRVRVPLLHLTSPTFGLDLRLVCSSLCNLYCNP